MASLTQTLRTAAHGLLGLSKATLNLEPIDDETLRQRRKACAACPAATRTKSLGLYPIKTLTPTSSCGVCRCNLHAKTRVAGESCPRGVWHAAEPMETAARG